MHKIAATFQAENPLEAAVIKLGLNDSVLTCARRWLAEQLVAHEYAKLGQGGHANTQVPLRRVFIDLPIGNSARPENDEQDRTPFLAKLLKTPPLALRQACSTDLLSISEQADMLSTDSSATKGNMLGLGKEGKSMRGLAGTLLIGGPGQGKSTLGQLACQFHRAALLKPLENKLTTSVRELVRSFEPTGEEQTQIDSRLKLPKRPLLPLQVSLPDLAAWLSIDPSAPVQKSYPAIIRFVTDLPSAKGCGFSAEFLAGLMSVMPTLLVLDGFDEVGAALDRERLVAAANELLKYLADRGGFAQVIATTRPQGYSGEFAKIGLPLRLCYLVPLRKDEALEYARKLVYEKIPGVDEREQTLKRLEEASKEPATERLLTTPLQVTILTALVQQRGRAPRERWNLFWGYFSYTYARETERHTYASQLLRDYKAHIEQIHARVALLLQVESERTGGAAARMSRVRLKEVIEAVLVEAGFEGDELNQLIIDIAIAAEQRLVFLVEPEPGSFGFEIRSFQEFMSAWALTSGREAQVEARLTEIARAPMFRNVLLFAASRLYSEASHLRDIFASKICGYLDNAANDPASSLTKSGALLALETLEEGAVLSFPRLARELVARASGILALPPSSEHLRLARAGTEDVRKVLGEVIEQAFLEPATKNVNANAAWIVVVEAANKHEAWAVKIGNQIWDKADDISKLLGACKSVSLTMGPWLRGKINKHRGMCKPEDFVGISEPSYSHKFIDDWVGALGKVYDASRGWERRNDALDSYTLRRSNEFRIRNEQLLKEIPAEWEGWCLAALFEMFPSPQTLASALKALAKSPKSTRDNIEWRSSWPMISCLRTARDEDDLKLIAELLLSGELGTESIWRKAESGWKWPDVERAAEKWVDGIPWDLGALRTSPPLTVMASWNLVNERTVARKTSQLECANRIFETTKSDATRRWMARACLSILRNLDGTDSVPSASIRDWVHLEPYLASFLIPQPACVPRVDWIELLCSLPPTQEIGYVSDFGYLIGLLEELPIRPLVLRTIVSAIRYTRGHELAHGALAQVRNNIRRLPPEAADTLDGRIIRLFLGELPESDDDQLVDDIAESLNEGEFYLAAYLSAIGEASLPTSRSTYLLSQIHSRIGSTRGLSKLIQLLRKGFQKRKSRLDERSIWDNLALALPYPSQSAEATTSGLSAEPVQLKKFELKDVAGVRGLSINLAAPTQPVGQWVVVLGPNGVGKTTLLRSIAIALRDTSDPTIWPKSSLSLDWVRVADGGEEQPQEASITVSLLNNDTYRTIIRSSSSTIFAQQQPTTTHRFPVFAYGCRRGSALGGALRMVNLSNDDGPEIASLFDETADLIHAETWLLQLEGDAARNDSSKAILRAISGALCEILGLDSLKIRNKGVWVSEHGGPELPFASLSDGYLTNAGWFVDLIARWLELAEQEKKVITGEFLSQMTGLVLIDEIDLHLHPRLQVEIISRTRSIMPRMSFVVTTHNPLTLVGARADEIWILSRHGKELVVEMGADAPMLLTGGQLYSRYFGITDVYPNSLGAKLQRYTFLGRFNLRTDEEEREMQEIKTELVQNGLLPDWDPVPRADGVGL